jgi:hypothetical protein
MQFGALEAQYIVGGQFRSTHTPYKTLQDRRRRPSSETQNTPIPREYRDPYDVRNSPSLQTWALSHLLETHCLTGYSIAGVPAIFHISHRTKQSQSRLFASQSLANTALFLTLTCGVLILCMQFLIGPKHPYMEQAAEHEPQPIPQSSPRRWSLCECGRWRRSRHSSCTLVASGGAQAGKLSHP